jgi:adenine-specific DNA-methyltransferase
MRYIGNKTRLLSFIGDVLERRGIAAGSAVDPFTGTASVARDLKRRGFRVVASDVMEYAYVFARAYVQVARLPAAPGLAREIGARTASLAAIVRHLHRLPPRPGFITEHYTPAGTEGAVHGRMYFTPENGARIDTIRTTLESWRNAALLPEDTFFVLLATLIEAADRVANTTGVYAAFVKSWQPNAVRPLQLRPPVMVASNGCRAARGDALDVVLGLEPFDLLYLDPPYNTRQYPGYYHIPELIATGWFNGEVVTRGKTGLVDDVDKRSDWSRSRHCEAAFERLVASAPWRRLVMSYNAEGIIAESTIERVLKSCGRRATYERYPLAYRRYRSDADGENRRYRGDETTEYLYCVDR